MDVPNEGLRRGARFLSSISLSRYKEMDPPRGRGSPHQNTPVRQHTFILIK